uniref:Methanethiol oxidase n=1 Tax=Meloidogyne incognita TaxID=6306 RepID=A0A914KHM6_MELIC
MSETKQECCACGPGYKSPLEAFKNAPREKIIFVTCPNVDQTKPDMLATVDVDPKSEDYCKIIGKIEVKNASDEVHHTGWNICSSCYEDAGRKRSHLILPCLNSSRIYIIDVTKDPKKPELTKTIEPKQLFDLGVGFPHTAHCLADGTIMISTLGDERDSPKGDFLLVNSETFEPISRWIPEGQNALPYNYDFWYQPRRGLMISTEWGSPKSIKQGFNPANVDKDYGHSVHVWDWQKRQLIQTIPLELPEGNIPLEVRFLHEPSRANAFVGTALGSAIFHFWRSEEGPGQMKHSMVVAIPPKKVERWALEWMPALITDILVSMDDRFLYISCWLHGDIRQYDITNPATPKLVGQCFIGGSIHKESGVKVLEDKELTSQPEPLFVKNKIVQGGPQMLQLSLDGRRLYVTNSLYSVWDKQFYPKLLSEGSTMLQLDVDIDNGGGLCVNKEFRIDFDKSEYLPNGPYLAHEMRYPGGDCTSDIWL